MLNRIKRIFFIPVTIFWKDESGKQKVKYSSFPRLKNWVYQLIPDFIRRIIHRDGGWISEKSGDNCNIYRRQTMFGKKPNLPNPNNNDLESLIETISEIKIFKRIGELWEEYEVEEICSIKESDGIKAGLKEFQINPKLTEDLWDYDGEISFDFITNSGRIYQIAYLGAGSIRWIDRWSKDVSLHNPVSFLEWLKNLGIVEPLEAWKQNIVVAEKSARLYKIWLKKVPKSIREYVLDKTDHDSIDNFFMSDFGKALSKLKKEIPNKKELILRLFDLYGTSFFENRPEFFFECLPQYILFEIPLKEILSSIEHSDLTFDQKNGIIRFLLREDSYNVFGSKLKDISNSTKTNLYEHLREYDTKDELNQFKEMFI